LHSYIRIVDDKLYIEDNGSKFGTLIKIKEPFEILRNNETRVEQNLF
jgi:hypothetical protein